MKSTFGVCVVLVVVCCACRLLCAAGSGGAADVLVFSPFGPTALTLNNAVTNSAPLDVSSFHAFGYYSMQMSVTGTGTVASVETEASADAVTWVRLTNDTYAVFDNCTTNTGPSLDGNHFTAISVPVTKHIRWRVAATNGVVNFLLKLMVY